MCNTCTLHTEKSNNTTMYNNAIKKEKRMMNDDNAATAQDDSSNAVTTMRQRTSSGSKLFLAVPILIISVMNFMEFAFEPSSSFDRKTRVEEGGSNDIALQMVDDDIPVIDIISVGSLLKATYQTAQQETFGNHTSVRNFYRVTEASDSDQECFMKLTTDQLDDIISFCSQTGGKEKFVSNVFRQILFKPKKHTGWMCAQKRPVDGLYYVLNQYKNGLEIPEYLFIIDDDTYINMDSLTSILRREFSPIVPRVVTGCNFIFLGRMGFTFPYGGFGSFLSKAAIERLLKPIDCHADERDTFTRFACWRLKSDNLGEYRFFHDGMSIGDLMYQYAAEQPFGDVKNWKSGYCLHSDHALAYFMNMYHIAVPDAEWAVEGLQPHDFLRKTYKYTALTNEKDGGREGECRHERDQCTVDSHVCHYIQPDQMESLYRESQRRQTSDSSSSSSADIAALP